MKAQLALCMKYMPAACMKSLTLTHEGWEFGFAKFQFIVLLIAGARSVRLTQMRGGDLYCVDCYQ